MPGAPHPLPSAWHRSQPPHNTHWACLAFSCPWLMKAEDMESSRDPCATRRELPARNSNCSLTGQSRHPALAPAPRERCALVSMVQLALAGLCERKPVAAFPSSGPWVREVRKDTPQARPTPSHKASYPLSLKCAIHAHTAVPTAQLQSWAQDHSVHCREEMSAVLRAAALLCPQQLSPRGARITGGEMPVLVPGLSLWD